MKETQANHTPKYISASGHEVFTADPDYQNAHRWWSDNNYNHRAMIVARALGLKSIPESSPLFWLNTRAWTHLPPEVQQAIARYIAKAEGR